MQLDWPSNAGARDALAVLEPIHQRFGSQMSYADLIVFAGNIAVRDAGGPELPFCSGRADADTGETSIDLSPRTYYQDPLTAAHDRQQVCSHCCCASVRSCCCCGHLATCGDAHSEPTTDHDPVASASEGQDCCCPGTPRQP